MGTRETVILIMGMRDASSAGRIAELFGSIPGVLDVDVSLHRARARVVHEAACSPATLVWTVVQAGFGAALPQAPEMAGGHK